MFQKFVARSSAYSGFKTKFFRVAENLSSPNNVSLLARSLCHSLDLALSSLLCGNLSAFRRCLLSIHYFPSSALKKLLRYSSVGLVVFLVQEAFLWGFHQWTTWGPRLSFWAVWLPSVALHFLLTKYFTFHEAGGDVRSQLARYGCATTVTTSVQYGTYHLALRYVTPQPNFAFGIAAFVGMSLNFLVMKWGVFETKTAPGAAIS